MALLQATRILLVPLLLACLSGCFRSEKDLAEDQAPGTPLSPGNYTNLMNGETISVELNGDRYDVKPGGGPFRFFAIPDSDFYIAQSIPEKSGDKFEYVFARIFEDTVIVFDQSFGKEPGTNVSLVPEDFTGKVTGSDYDLYNAADPSITRDFLRALLAQGEKNRTLLWVAKKTG